jgi:hypothetical protein
LDLSSWICLSKRYLCSTDASHILFRRGNVVEVAEDDIKTDCFTFEDVFPLGFGEPLRGCGCSSDLSLGKVEVFLEYGEGLSRPSPVLVNLSGLCCNLGGVPR